MAGPEWYGFVAINDLNIIIVFEGVGSSFIGGTIIITGVAASRASPGALGEVSSACSAGVFKSAIGGGC